MEALPQANPWELDNLVVPVPWRTEQCTISPPGRKLKIGYILDDGIVRPQPPITRALKEVIAALQGAGHEGMTDDVKTLFRAMSDSSSI